MHRKYSEVSCVQMRKAALGGYAVTGALPVSAEPGAVARRRAGRRARRSRGRSPRTGRRSPPPVAPGASRAAQRARTPAKPTQNSTGSSKTEETRQNKLICARRSARAPEHIPRNNRQGASSRSVGRATQVPPAGVAAARSSPFSVRHSEQTSKAAHGRTRWPGRPPWGGTRAGEGARRPAPRPDRAEGNRCQPSPPGVCPWWPCSSPAR
jgi:hypothetical protein